MRRRQRGNPAATAELQGASLSNLADHCGRLLENGLPKEGVDQLLHDMPRIAAAVRSWPAHVRRHKGIRDEWLA